MGHGAIDAGDVVSLADLLEQRIGPRTPHPCPVPGILATLEERDAAALRAALEPGVMDTDEMRRHLADAGVYISDQLLRAHKRTVRAARNYPTTGLRCSCPSQTI